MGDVWDDTRLRPEVLKRAEETARRRCPHFVDGADNAKDVWNCEERTGVFCHLPNGDCLQYPNTASNEELVRELSGCGGSVTSAIRADYGDDTWDALKQEGSEHYKTGSVEPIDLYRAAGAFRHFALCSIIKYAFRNIRITGDRYIKDLDKIIDFARKLNAECRDDARRT